MKIRFITDSEWFSITLEPGTESERPQILVETCNWRRLGSLQDFEHDFPELWSTVIRLHARSFQDYNNICQKIIFFHPGHYRIIPGIPTSFGQEYVMSLFIAALDNLLNVYLRR